VGVLDDDAVRVSLRHAWQESQAGTADAHEEGGFILRDENATFSVERWPRGAQNRIIVPPHPDCKREGRLIVATFHTHPNPGAEYQQEPSLTDIRAVRGDPDLALPEYEGEFVIASEFVYRIHRSGDVETVGETKNVLMVS